MLEPTPQNGFTPPPPSHKYIKIVSFVISTLVLVTATAGVASNVSQENLKSVQAASYPDHIVNGDFEYMGIDILSVYDSGFALISPMNYIYYSNSPATPIWKAIPSNFDYSQFGWKSTQNKYTVAANVNLLNCVIRNGAVEIRNDIVNGTRVNTHCELVEQQADTAIYQDIATTPGSVYKWSLKHCSQRPTHVDTMSVMIGNTAVQTAQPATRTTSNGTGQIGPVGTIISTISTHSADEHMDDWETYEGVYVIPQGQNVTRFTFKSIEGINETSGNELDDISFTIADPLYYDLNGGTGNLPIPEASGTYPGYFQRGTTQSLSGIVPTREGYTFLGWTETKCPDVSSFDELTASQTIKSKKITAGANYVYALWAKNPTVSYIDPLDDNKVVYSTEIPFGSAAPELASSNIPTHDHYDFTGYATPLPQEVYEDTAIPLAYKGSAVKLRVRLVNAKNNSPLRWAGFKISADAKTDIDTLSLITDPNGCATFDGIAFGDYTAHLVDRPEGFLYPDYIADFTADPALADKGGYITVEIPVMPQLSRRTSEYESDNAFDFYYPAWIAVYGDDELVMGRGTGYPYASYDGKPLNEEYIWLDVERRELGTRPFWDVKEQITSVKVIDRIRPLNPQMWFLHFSACTSYDVTKLDMSACTSLQMFFGGNHAAEEVDVTGWDTSNVTTMSACFSSWGTNPDGTDFIFKDNKLKRIKGLETWDTSKCELFGDAFSRNWNLEDIGDIGGWDMSSAWSVHHMFVEDLKLKTNVSGWRRTINPEVIGIGYCDVEKKTMCFNGYNEISGGHSSYAAGVIY